MDSTEAIISPTFNATGHCVNGWVCEHRWPEIRSMAKFRNAVGDAPLNWWWDNGYNQIAFCRGNRGFIAINNGIDRMEQQLQTCLPEGVYTDIISACIPGREGNKVVVDKDGKAQITVNRNSVVAIHVTS